MMTLFLLLESNLEQLSIEGINHPSVLSYIEVIKEKKPVGKKVAIIGAGGIGFDVAEYLSTEQPKALDAESKCKSFY